tara:strand:+ start:5068 stop:6060 length:993 start_codon:yes stop_codon:yes gene_type:complete
MKSYKVLSKQKFVEDDYSLIPIRKEDRFKIMKWRNEQIFHLRQKEPLTKEKQDLYFTEIIENLFSQNFPDQILFSFLKNNKCIGYGGLVHINWDDDNAEVSLVLSTDYNNNFFIESWKKFLSILKTISFKYLNLKKIYTYAYDVRPNLYIALENSGFSEEKRLKKNHNFNGKLIDIVYHSCFNTNNYLKLLKVQSSDSKILFEWRNDITVRKSSFNKSIINWDDHLIWFNKKINSPNSKNYLARDNQNIPIGQIRLDLNEKFWLINFSIDKSFRGLGYGKKIIFIMLKLNRNKKFLAKVKSENIASQKVFKNLHFTLINKTDTTLTYRFI